MNPAIMAIDIEDSTHRIGTVEESWYVVAREELAMAFTETGTLERS
jgi:hypothetical protein